MKFKMSPNSLFAILLRSPWWISFALVGLFSLAAAAVLPREYLFAGILGTFPFFAVGCVAAWRQWRAPSAARMAAAHAQIESLPWRGFADALEVAWRTGGHTDCGSQLHGAQHHIARRGNHLEGRCSAARQLW